MASQIHLDTVFYSGIPRNAQPFESKSRLILTDNGVGIFLQVASEAEFSDEVPMLTLGADGARSLIEGLTTALGNIGEL